MQPSITFLSDELVQRVLGEAYQLLIKPGIKVQSPAAMQLLEETGLIRFFLRRLKLVLKRSSRSCWLEMLNRLSILKKLLLLEKAMRRQFGGTTVFSKMILVG